MFNKIKSALLLMALLVVSTLYYNPVKAQEKKDSITVVSVFTGNEQNLTDTLLAYGRGATDLEFKAVITEAVDVIKDTPKDGKAESWYAWVIAALGAIFGVYQYVKKKTASPVAPDTRYR